MEDKNSHPSLPSNYVTLAQLQERWLKQKEKDKQLQEKQQEEQQQNQQQHITKRPQHNPRECHQRRYPKAQQQAWRAILAHPTTGLGHAAVERPPKNPNVPESDRVAVEVSRETNESMEAKAEIEDENDDQDGKEKQSKKKRGWGKRKPRADTEKKKLPEDATESTIVGNKETANSDVKRIDEQAETKIELNESRSNGLMMEVEQKLGTISMNSENQKQNRVKITNSSRGSQGRNGGHYYRIGTHGRVDKEKKKLAEHATQSTMVGNKEIANSHVKRIGEKAETKIELNDGKSNGLMMEVERKLGTISMNSENEKQNRVKTNGSSRDSQRRNGGRNYRVGTHGRVDEEKKKLAEDATQSTMVGNKERANSDVKRIDEKAETKIELNDSKSNGLMVEVERKLGTISVNSENEKQNRVKTNGSSRGSQKRHGGRNYSIGTHGRVDKEKKKLAEDAARSTMVGNKEVANSDFQGVDDKRETKIELKGGKSNNLMSEVEQKLGNISMNSEHEKKNSRVKAYDGSRGSQRNHGVRNYRTGPYGGRIRTNQVRWGRADQKIWVRKSEDSNDNDDHKEISNK